MAGTGAEEAGTGEATGTASLIGRAENLKLLGARASKSLPNDLLERAAGLPLLDEQIEG